MPVATVNRAGSRQASTLWSLRCARAIDCAILPGVYLGGLIGNPASGREYRPFPVPGCPRGGLWCCDTRRGEPRVHHIYQCCYTGGCLQPGDKLRGEGFQYAHAMGSHGEPGFPDPSNPGGFSTPTPG